MISVVIPNFNGAKLLERNLPKLLGLLEESKLGFEVIVVDDASKDNSLEVISSFKSSFRRGGLLKVISKITNEGFASTVDAGIREAKGEIVFTLKTDAVPESADYFQIMLDHFELKKDHPLENPLEKDDPSSRPVFAVSAALHTVEDGKPEVRGQGVITFSRGFFLHFRTFDDYKNWLSKSSKLLNGYIAKLFGSRPNNNVTIKQFNNGVSAWADGGAMAVRRDLYLKIGGFDPLYNPFYWEDVDLGFRAWKVGYQVGYEPRAVLLHAYQSGAIARHYTEEQVRIISQRNQFIFVWKNGDWKHLLSYCFWESYHVAIALKNRNWNFFKAYWQAMLLWPRILMARWRQKNVTKLADDQVLDFFDARGCFN